MQLGAIIGSIAALVVIIVAVGIYLSQQKRTRQSEIKYDYYSSYEGSSFSGVVSHHTRPKKPRYPPRPADVIPGGVPFPAYRAVPIKNPRGTQNPKRTYV